MLTSAKREFGTELSQDRLLRHYQAIGVSAVVAALNATMEAVEAKGAMRSEQTPPSIPQFLQSDEAAAKDAQC